MIKKRERKGLLLSKQACRENQERGEGKRLGRKGKTVFGEGGLQIESRELHGGKKSSARIWGGKGRVEKPINYSFRGDCSARKRLPRRGHGIVLGEGVLTRAKLSETKKREKGGGFLGNRMDQKRRTASLGKRIPLGRGARIHGYPLDLAVHLRNRGKKGNLRDAINEASST